MSFARPELLWLALLALPELALGLARAPAFRASLEALSGPRRRARAGRAFAAASFVGSSAGALFVLSAVIALAGPSWGLRGAAVPRSGLEAALVLDVSRSMYAKDAASPGAAASARVTRLEAAKALASGLIGASGGESFSLVAAKGGSVLLAPMTEDAYALGDALGYADAAAITSPGTDLEGGLRCALSSFSAAGARNRIVFLFSDGGELSGSARRACDAVAAAGARLVVVGLGGDSPALVPGLDGKPLQGAKGPVRSARDAKRLQSLASQAGGAYVDASEPGAAAVLADELSRARGRGLRIEYERVDREGAFALLAFAFLLIALLASMLSTRGGRA
jgi:Ca-activated chloride channel homolog